MNKRISCILLSIILCVVPFSVVADNSNVASLSDEKLLALFEQIIDEMENRRIGNTLPNKQLYDRELTELLFSPYIRIYNMDGSSMNNTLNEGEKLLCTKYDFVSNNPSRGDVVACNYPNRGNTIFIKRLVALPGDTIQILNGQLYINGNPEENPPDIKYPFNRDYPKRTLGNDEYFVIGDNRGYSHDSRYNDVDALTKKQILAHVRYVIYPFNKIRKIE